MSTTNAQHANARITSAQHSNSAQPVDGLFAEESETRLRTAESLRSEYKQLVDSLVLVVESNEVQSTPSTRAIAARLLGEFHAVSAVPALLRKLEFEVTTPKLDFRDFYMEAYPCAEAIAAMGPSALRPTLMALANRKDPLSEKEVNIAAHLIASLCDESREKASIAFREAMEVAGDSKNLRSIQAHMNRFIGLKNPYDRIKAVRQE